MHYVEITFLYFSCKHLQPPSAIKNSSITNYPHDTEFHIDIQQLDEVLQRYFAADLASFMHKTYAASECSCLYFCKDFNLLPFPVSESTLCYLMACLGQQGLVHSFILTYLSGVRQMQITHSLVILTWTKCPDYGKS